MSMFEVSRVSAEIGDSEISFETGKLAKQASGSVVVRSGDTMVLCTATMGNLRDVVNVRDNRHAEFAFDVPQNFQAGFHAYPAKALDRRSIRLIE